MLNRYTVKNMQLPLSKRELTHNGRRVLNVSWGEWEALAEQAFSSVAQDALRRKGAGVVTIGWKVSLTLRASVTPSHPCPWQLEGDPQ